MKPTPGPWTVKKETQVVGDFDYFADGLLVADCGKPRKSDNENKANARLIAAAPDLLEACKWAATSCHHPKCTWNKGKCTCHVEPARAAIARATGEGV